MAQPKSEFNLNKASDDQQTFQPQSTCNQAPQLKSLSTLDKPQQQYFLPNFIENEEENSSGNNNQSQNIERNSAFARSYPWDPSIFQPAVKQSISMTSPEFRRPSPSQLYGQPNGLQESKNKQVCNFCKLALPLNNQGVEQGIDVNGNVIKYHSVCYVQQYSKNGAGTGKIKDSPGYTSFLKSAQVSETPLMASPFSEMSQLQVNLSPNQLFFEFQLLHPLTYTCVFSLSNLNSNYIFDSEKQCYVFNKLLCNSMIVPFNMVIARFKWDFFKDLSQETDPAKQQLYQLGQKYSQHISQNLIQGLINFQEMQDHQDKTLTITLKSQNQEMFMFPGFQSSIINLNFRYLYIREPYQIGQPVEEMSQIPLTYLLKNLYFNFVFQRVDFEKLQAQVTSLIRQEPQLFQLLKPPDPAIPDPQQRFQTMINSQTSLHSLVQSHHQPTYSADANNFQNFSPGYSNIPMPPGMSGQGSSTYAVSGLQRNFSPQQQQQPPMNYVNLLHGQKTFSGQKPHTITSINDESSTNAPLVQQKAEENQQFTEAQNEPNQSKDQRMRAQTSTFNISSFEPGTHGEDYTLLKGHSTLLDEESHVDRFKAMDRNNFKGLQHQSASTGLHLNQRLEGMGEDQQFLNPSVKSNKKKKKKESGNKKDKNNNSSSSIKSMELSSKGPYGGASGLLKEQSSSVLKEGDENESNSLQNELKGQIVEMAKQQQGSKYLQKLLAKASPDFVGFAIDECLNHFQELMVDQYGNYFCQKLLQSSSSAQRLKILQALKPHILKISCDRKGTHSMQCLIEMINMGAEEEELKDGISQHVIALSYDPNGTHVLQKVMLCMKEENLDFIFDPVFENLVNLSMDQNGLCVIKKLILKIQSHEKRTLVGDKLSNNSVQLVQSPFGNYAVQQALDHWPIEYSKKMFEKLEPHLLQLSVQKCSSNVIEKVLENAETSIVARYEKQLTDHEVMKSLIKNGYGYYVLQKLATILRKHKLSTKRLLQAVEATLQYATEKNLKAKWVNLISQL